MNTIGDISNTQQALYNQVQYVQGLLTKAGFVPGSLVETYATAQVMYETNGLTSPLAQKYNNLSGITFINKPYQKNAYHATNNYAGFATPQDWANDYYRILSLSPGKPIAATSFQQFFQGLVANHYFGDSQANYSAGLNTWIKKINDAINAANATWQQIQKTGVAEANADTGTKAITQAQYNPFHLGEWWDGLPTIQKFGVGAAAVGLLLLLTKD